MKRGERLTSGSLDGELQVYFRMHSHIHVQGECSVISFLFFIQLIHFTWIVKTTKINISIHYVTDDQEKYAVYNWCQWSHIQTPIPVSLWAKKKYRKFTRLKRRFNCCLHLWFCLSSIYFAATKALTFYSYMKQSARWASAAHPLFGRQLTQYQSAQDTLVN